MIRTLVGISFTAIMPGAVFGQSIGTTPRFEVADVHRSAQLTILGMPNGVLRGGRYDWRNATMLDLIRSAFGVDADKVLGGPNWLELDHFDVAAKAPLSTPPATIRVMLQNLLSDRFKLVLHKDTKPLPAFVLAVGKGKLKLKEADGSGDATCRPQRQPGLVAYACRNMTMAAFAERLPEMAGLYITKPVVDATDLKGTWNFDLKWNGRYQVLAGGVERTTIFDAIDQQLGLTLELQKAPAPVLVIDRVNEKPTGNPPGVEQMLPPRETEFEVAAIKPSRPDETIGPSDAAFDRNYHVGRFEVQAFPMNFLIATAWGIDWQHVDEMLVGAPKWIDSARFDIVAKMSPTVGSEGWDADLRLMLRALLIDRFRLKTHYEDRLVKAYSLVASKPKLRKADPSNRAGCKEERANDPRDINPKVSWLVTCQNITMAQFAELLQDIARDCIPNEVADATGIKGAWDVTLRFTPQYLLQSGGGSRSAGPPTAAAPTASEPAAAVPNALDPTGGVSLFDALQKQLGLKLEMHKRMMPVLVIDHIEEKPTDN